MVATTEAATLKSRYQREVNELRDQLQRANISSERDQALREKVFNEAKAEVIALNKKVDESWRKHFDPVHFDTKTIRDLRLKTFCF